MPRDGSNVYTQPSPNVVDGTTIESAVYNLFTNDVALDLNTPRPIVAGGTGASNAEEARSNLNAEVYGVGVTNYDSHAWEPGSFYSLPGATGIPAGAGEYFSGVCHILNPDHVTLEMRGYSAGDTGKSWTRQKVTGVWQPWELSNYDTVNPDGSGYASTTADMFYGLRAVAPNSYFAVNSKADLTGTNIFTVTKAGAVTANGDIWAVRSPTEGVYYFGSTGIRFLRYDGANFNLAGGSLYIDDGSLVRAGDGIQSRAGIGGAYGASSYNIHWTGVAQLWIDSSNLGTITTTSDYRIKKDVVDLPSTWDTVKALRPVKYTQAQFSPPSHVGYAKENSAPLFAADDVERWGFIAHELQATLVESAATGVKDSPDTVQSPNWPPVVAALTKALQEAMTRIEALEAG